MRLLSLEELKVFGALVKSSYFWIAGEMANGTCGSFIGILTSLSFLGYLLYVSRLQIVCNAKESTVAVGDICGMIFGPRFCVRSLTISFICLSRLEFNGKMGQTPAGQTSLFAVSGRILSPCLRQIPVELTNDASLCL